MYQRLNQLRKDNRALWSAEKGAPMVRIPADNDKIFTCVRQKICPKCGNNTVLAVMNMSGEEQKVNLDLTGYEGTYKCLCGKEKELAAQQEMTLKPWSWKILTR